jgi:ATP-binding cassette, subfamily C (CFTR/MRP), member 1
MNAVERILVYTELPPEGATHTPNDPPQWPTTGEIKFQNVEMAYRKGLPLVLKDVSFQVNPGEKVGIVGRTGAGKSSLLQVSRTSVQHTGVLTVNTIRRFSGWIPMPIGCVSAY